MPTVVTRLYADAENVDAAIKALKDESFGSMDYDVVAAGVADAEAHLRKYGVPKKDAPAFASGVRAGNTAIVVRAPFGAAGKAIYILDNFGPVDVSAARGSVLVSDGTRYRRNRLTGATILSGPMLPAIVSWRAPFEYLFWAPSLLKGKSGTRLFSRYTTPLSSILPFPVILTNKKKKQTKLLNDPTPLSSRLGLPLLVKYRSRTHVS